MNNMNKKTYMLPGDERIVAGNAEEFVHELRVGSWMDSDCTDEQYMHNFAERYVVQAGVRIATDTPEPRFVKSSNSVPIGSGLPR